MLDVGAATGAFVRAAVAAGWEAFGMEPSGEARAVGNASGTVLFPSIDEAARLAPFEVITLHHVLEHLEDPVKALTDLRGLLSPKGLLLVEVPNWGSFERMGAGADWIDLRPEQHLSHWTPRTIRALLRQAGYEVGAIYTRGEPVPSVSSILASVGLNRRRSVNARVAADGEAGQTGPCPVGVGRPTAKLVELTAKIIDRILDQKRVGRRLVAVAQPPDH
jgi:SAM-dependent methyltransferase